MIGLQLACSMHAEEQADLREVALDYILEVLLSVTVSYLTSVTVESGASDRLRKDFICQNGSEQGIENTPKKTL